MKLHGSNLLLCLTQDLFIPKLVNGQNDNDDSVNCALYYGEFTLPFTHCIFEEVNSTNVSSSKTHE